jgi:hypothetical protein
MKFGERRPGSSVKTNVCRPNESRRLLRFLTVGTMRGPAGGTASVRFLLARPPRVPPFDGRRFPSFEHAEHEVLHWIGLLLQRRKTARGARRLAARRVRALEISRQATPQCCPPDNRASNGPRVVHFLSAGVRAASSMEASMFSKSLLSIVSISGPVSRPMGPPLGTYR